ncbi:hypothetical protein [Dyella sp.]|nr:hypothetical protein [Dyella sp.]MDR3447409.1 hypothetical protein [Dyella sp.]
MSVALAFAAYFVGMVVGNVTGMWLADQMRVARLRNKRRIRGLSA